MTKGTNEFGSPRLPFGGNSFDTAEYRQEGKGLEPFFSTDLGSVFDLDCMDFLKSIKDDSIDTFFADPPFNLNKEYGKSSSDSKAKDDYVDWCIQWLNEAERITKLGGSLFVYNLPKWNFLLASHLEGLGLNFRHWITVNIKFGLPIQGRLYPSHYSLLYFTKGKAKTFRKIRTPIEVCRHCGGDIKDYGGHRGAMNPKGVNLTDVWNDIPPVRHWKYKSVKRKANALSTKLLDRVVEMSTEPRDVVVDPFAGSGTTAAVCESKGRKWLVNDIDFAPVVRERLSEDLFIHKNTDVVDLG